MTRVLALTHGPDVRPELFAEVIAERGDDLREWDIRSRGAPPQAGYDAVMVFGGAQNVGEELDHPWLHEEYDALRRWVSDGLPVFAICLGAQTLAHALGGPVCRVEPAPLAGFEEIELTEAGAADPVLGVLPRRFEALCANGYAFAVPPHATELARGSVPQAFRVGGRAWAVQFHPEVRHDQAMAWFTADEHELVKSLATLRAELDEKLPEWQEHGRNLCRAFLAAAAR